MTKLFKLALVGSLVQTVVASAQNFSGSPNISLAPAQNQSINPSTLYTTPDTTLVQDQAPQSTITDAPANLLQEKVSVNYRGAPLVDVIRSLAEGAKINHAVTSSVIAQNQDVYLTLSNVTYDIVIKTVLDMHRLGAVVENGILRVDTLDNIAAEKAIKAAAKEQGWRTEPARSMIYQINYARAEDISRLLMQQLRAFAVDRRFSVQADPRSNKIIVHGVADALVEAKTLIENLDRRKQQVLIEARIVEASSELSRTLSVTWGTRFGIDAQRGLASGIIFPNSMMGSVGGAGALGQPAPQMGTGSLPTQLGSFNFSLGSINNMINVDGILRAYETESLANIIASPRIVVQDQDEANITENTRSQRFVLRNTSEEMRDTLSRLSLAVRPQITSDNTLELQIVVERNSPNNAPTDPVQGITERRAQTRLLVNNGETAVIGGLYQTQKFKGQGRIPLLGKIPIIGFLFRSNDQMSMRSELMVLITPRILPQGGGGSAASTGGIMQAPEIPGAGAQNLGGNAANFGNNGGALNNAASNLGGNGGNTGTNNSGGNPAGFNNAGNLNTQANSNNGSLNGNAGSNMGSNAAAPVNGGNGGNNLEGGDNLSLE